MDPEFITSYYCSTYNGTVVNCAEKQKAKNIFVANQNLIRI